jgi:hypothetical protein
MNIAEKLVHEIVRCTEIRKDCEAMRGMTQVNVEFLIASLTASINRAEAAMGTGEALDIMRALKDLEDFES